jgi:hypothetical protein
MLQTSDEPGFIDTPLQVKVSTPDIHGLEKRKIDILPLYRKVRSDKELF